jgi:predicted  nucleic acid-binding Zn-ribbon protein
MSVITNEKNRLSSTQNTLNTAYNEQERIRKNITTVGSGSVQGQEYIKKLTALDKEIDTINADIYKIRESLQKAQKAFDNYAANLNI